MQKTTTCAAGWSPLELPPLLAVGALPHLPKRVVLGLAWRDGLDNEGAHLQGEVICEDCCLSAPLQPRLGMSIWRDVAATEGVRPVGNFSALKKAFPRLCTFFGSVR